MEFLKLGEIRVRVDSILRVAVDGATEDNPCGTAVHVTFTNGHATYTGDEAEAVLELVDGHLAKTPKTDHAVAAKAKAKADAEKAAEKAEAKAEAKAHHGK